MTLGRAGDRGVELGVVAVALADQELLEDVVVAVQLDLGGEGVVDREHGGGSGRWRGRAALTRGRRPAPWSARRSARAARRGA
jgi:hypothetical protein